MFTGAAGWGRFCVPGTSAFGEAHGGVRCGDLSLSVTERDEDQKPIYLPICLGLWAAWRSRDLFLKKPTHDLGLIILEILFGTLVMSGDICGGYDWGGF